MCKETVYKRFPARFGNRTTVTTSFATHATARKWVRKWVEELYVVCLLQYDAAGGFVYPVTSRVAAAAEAVGLIQVASRAYTALLHPLFQAF